MFCKYMLDTPAFTKQVLLLPVPLGVYAGYALFYQTSLIAASAPARKTLQINNLCEMILGGDSGEYLYLQSRGRSQFLDKREMPLAKL